MAAWEAMQHLGTEAAHEQERTRWLRLELALVLAEATGRRLGAIRALGWEDIGLTRGRIGRAAEADKHGLEHTTPVAPALAEELRTFRRRLGAVGGLLFPAE